MVITLFPWGNYAIGLEIKQQH